MSQGLKSRPEYNVGDLVRCIDPGGHAAHGLVLGQMGTVKHIALGETIRGGYVPGRWYTKIDTYDSYAYSSRFELCTNIKDILENPEKYRNELFRLIKQATA